MITSLLSNNCTITLTVQCFAASRLVYKHVREQRNTNILLSIPHIKFNNNMLVILVFTVLGYIHATSARFIIPKVATGDLTHLESSISNSSCEFYTNLEIMSPCGSEGYVQKFIYKYCMAYLSRKDEFINQAWQNGVRVCLQRKMLTYLQSDPNASCSEIKKHGFDSHTGCYLQPDSDQPELTFCTLPWQDIGKVIWIAKGAIFEPAAWSQLNQLTKYCASQIFQG